MTISDEEAAAMWEDAGGEYKPRRLWISFSGGETSAYMANWLVNGEGRQYWDDVAILFANTGQENEETLEFVQRCDEHFGLGVVWIEAETQHGLKKSPIPRVVNFETASRNGEPFEDYIRKHGIPNLKFKTCTRELKTRPMRNYIRSIGWKKGTHKTAIGIRVDEIDRCSAYAESQDLIYPLCHWHPMTKPQVNEWWRKQPFRLNLKGYEGNCTWCWKKSLRKHMTLIEERPGIYDFPRRMEKIYPRVGPEFRKDVPKPQEYRRTFFRENRSTDDLFREYELRKDLFVRAHDDSQVFEEELDVGAGCEESCEIFADEDMQMRPPLSWEGGEV